MTAKIHPSAIVSDDADVGDDVEIGPGAIIERDVHIGAGTVVEPYTMIRRYTRIGKGNRLGPYAVLGGEPQHKAYDGSETWLTIGDNNDIKEFAIISRAFEPGGETRIGSDCLIMGLVHIAHDCVIGDRVTMTNQAVCAGHVEVGSGTVFSGSAGAHQFVRIGRLCMLGPNIVLRKDVLPFTMVADMPARHFRLNTVGLKRNGITGDRYRALEKAFRALRNGNRTLDGVPDTEEIRYLKDWLAADSHFGLLPFARPASRSKSA